MGVGSRDTSQREKEEQTSSDPVVEPHEGSAPFAPFFGALTTPRRRVLRHRPTREQGNVPRPEEDSRESEERYRAIFESANDAIAFIALDGTITSVNRSAERLVGLPREQIIGRPYTQFLTPASNALGEERLQRALAGELLPSTFEIELLRANGHTAAVEARTRFLRARDGTVTGFLGIYRDITDRKRTEEAFRQAQAELENRAWERTSALMRANAALQVEIEERKRAEEALRESEERYRDLFENATDVIGTGTLDNIITSANRRIEQMLGYPREEFIGKHFLDFVTPKSRALIEDRTRRRLAGEQVSPTVELELVHRDSSIVIVEGTIRARRDPSGKPIGVHAIYRDITARKRAEAALEQLRQQNELILTSAAEGIFGTDAQGRATFVNPAGARMLGYEVHELLGHCLHDLVHHHKADGTPYAPAECPSLQVTRSGRTVRVTNEVYWRKDGTSFPVEYLTAPIWGSADEVIGLVATFRDITERKEVERMKDELIATVSHELRTPLASLCGFAEIMLQRDFPPEKQRDLLTIIRNESIRLSRLIDDFLDLQLIESGHQPYAFSWLALEPLLRESAELFTNTEDPHPLRLAIAPALPPVRGDANRLRQVLVNLISNAVKFSPRKTEIEVGARTEAQQVVAWVTDHGIGIPPEAVPKLFTKFFRVDNSDTRHIGGTGLGLALVREIMSAHQGNVWVESRLGSGSTFFIALPHTRMDA